MGKFTPVQYSKESITKITLLLLAGDVIRINGFGECDVSTSESSAAVRTAAAYTGNIGHQSGYETANFGAPLLMFAIGVLRDDGYAVVEVPCENSGDGKYAVLAYYIEGDFS